MVKKRQSRSARETVQAAIPLYVLSDSTGNLAKHMVTTFLTQFPAGAFHLHLKPFVGEHRRLAQAITAIGEKRGIVFHAVVTASLKEEINRQCEEMKIACCDLTGAAVNFLADASQISPLLSEQPLHPVDSVYSDRINAMAFTLEHDDGLGLNSLNAADIVLVGISRTGKTPTSIYLAMQGYRVANVSLAMSVVPPRELLELGPGKTIGLIISPQQLFEIRTRRQTAWKMSQTAYNSPDEVDAEINWSRRLFTKLQYPVLDVTDQAIEETSARILDVLGFSPPPCHAAEGLA